MGSQSASRLQSIEGPRAPCAWGWRHFSCVPLPPGLNVANNGLPTIFHIDVLHRDCLLATVPVLAQSLDLGRVGARQFVVRPLMRFELRELFGIRHSSTLSHQRDVRCCHLDCQHTLDAVPRGNLSDNRREEPSHVCCSIIDFGRLERRIALKEKSLIHGGAFTAEDFVHSVFAVLRNMQRTTFVPVEGKQIIFRRFVFDLFNFCHAASLFKTRGRVAGVYQ